MSATASPSPKRSAACAPDQALRTGSSGIRPSKNSRRRAAVLVSVHIVFLIHLTHWLVNGRTLSLMEPSEAMATLELGEVNVGFIFFTLAIASTFLFGRLFCGWGCHIVALQDLCGWIMKKMGIRPKLFRTRFLIYVPMVVAFYMFLWPTLKREILFPVVPGALSIFRPVPPRPELTSHLLTDGFWDTMPPLAIGIPFLLVCGFATVYFLGAKGFCTYACPYGGVFGVIDKVSFGKINADLNACEGCAHCTATCTSNVRIHEEIQIYSAVVNPGCMKCLDCVSVCPKGALSYGYSRPSIFRKALRKKKTRIFDVSLGEEITLAAYGLCVFGAVRGIYGWIPMLFALGIAACLTFLTWKLGRLLRDRQVAIHRLKLKTAGTLERAGNAYVTAMVLLNLVVLHCAVINFERWCGNRSQILLEGQGKEASVLTDPGKGEARVVAEAAIAHYLRARSWRDGGWAFFSHPDVERNLGGLYLMLGDSGRAVSVLEGLRDRGWDIPRDRFRLGNAYLLAGETEKGESELAGILDRFPHHHATRDRLVQIYVASGRVAEAEAIYEEVLADNPTDAVTRRKLAHQVYVPTRRYDRALAELRRATQDAPADAQLWHDLAALELVVEDLPGALTHMREAVRRGPNRESFRARYDELRNILRSEIARLEEEFRQSGGDTHRSRQLEVLRQTAHEHLSDR